ncbi:MAG TPA: hypothetical protein VE399_05675, partial [Gemmatimonadales bacterium]|nr:hypothetical protein [Gemmatimonadales bacterium]
MTSAAELRDRYDATDVPSVVAGSIKLGLLETLLVLVFSLASRFLDGILETIVCAVIVVAGLAVVTMLPGLWT